jgi:phage terminase large subunit
MFQLTTATKKIAQLQKRIRAVQGGTSASKTVSILLLLIHAAQSDKTPTLTSIVSESFPHLKRGVMRDFLQIMEQHRYYKDERWNKTDFIYTFETGSKLEFFSADQPSKVRGPRRDRLFINEANNIPYEAFDQLEVRTKDYVYLDWNPTIEFWFYDKVLGVRDDVDHLIITYRDNEALDPAIVRSIEQRRNNKAWWQVYGEGLLGEIETRIYTGWSIIDEIPEEARLERYGLDFGYTNDPTAIVAIYYHNGRYIWDEIAYQHGLSNKMIADILLQQPKARIVADSAEPKSIDELKGYKLTVTPANKGPGSLLQGIQNVQQQWIAVTKRSVNIIKEYRNYLWITDKDGRILNEPIDIYNHAMDAGRYAMESLRPNKQKPVVPMTVQGGVKPFYPSLGI